MSCRGICERYKLVNIRRDNGNLSYYSDINPDRKYCSRCACRIIWAGINCPCCSFRLRTKPRNYKMVVNPNITNETNVSKLTNITILNEPIDQIEIVMPPLFAK